jgi:hypothetical protein
MDNTGGHCVLGSPQMFGDDNEAPSSDVTNNIQALDISHLELDYQLHLHATEFEEFLVKIYFSELAWYWVHGFPVEQRQDIMEDKIPAELEEFLVRVFTSSDTGKVRPELC